MRKLVWVVPVAGLLLGACNNSSTIRTTEENRTYTNLKGSFLKLHQPLSLAPDRARVFIQDGKVLEGYGVNEYAVQCNFEIDTIQHQGVTIEPDTFLIERVQALYEQVVMNPPVQVAQLQLNGLQLDGQKLGDHQFAMFEPGGTSKAFEGYHFWLSSPAQPNVRRLTCHGIYAEPADLVPPNLREIRETLGGVVSFSS